jgi:tetratricopeptide (TPR) repeat protein
MVAVFASDTMNEVAAPPIAATYLAQAAGLRGRGLDDEAASVLAEAAARLPANKQIATTRAWLANQRRDHADAVLQWEAIRARWPDDPVGYLGGGHALRDSRQLDEARGVLDQAAGRFPADAKVAALRGWVANAQSDWATAIPCWEQLRQCAPDDPAGYLGGATALREAGQPGAAEALLAEAAQLFPAHEPIALTYAALAEARRDWNAAAARWHSFRQAFPANPRGYLGAARAARELGETEAAESFVAQAAEAVAQAGLPASDVDLIELDIAVFRMDWAAARGAARRVLANGGPPSRHVWLNLAQAHWHLGEPDDADHAAICALEIAPALADAVLVRALVATARGDGEAALRHYRRLAELTPRSSRWALKVVQLLNWLGHVPEAVAEVERLGKLWPRDPMVRVYQRNYGPAAGLALPEATPDDDPAETDAPYVNEAELRCLAAQAPDPARHRRPIVVVDPGLEMQVCPVAGAETVLLVFTGSNDTVAMPLPLFDSFLAAWNVSVVYLKDFRRLRFLNGIASIGGDYLATLDALRAVCDGLGVRRLCTFGNCDGGFGAIRYGVELGAARVVAFGSPTHTPPETPARLEQARNFMRRRLATLVPDEMTDLRPIVATQPGRTCIDLFYDADDARDTLHAQHLGGLPGVTLTPRPGQGRRDLLRRMALAEPKFWNDLQTRVLCA